MSIVVKDIVLLALICVVPAISHVAGVALYKLNPMLLCLSASMLLVGDRRNAYLMAVLLPLTSMVVTGMPLMANMLCMIPELLVFVALFDISRRRIPLFVSYVAAALASKVVFYALRALFVAPVVLIGTSVWLQLGAVAAWGLVFCLVSALIKQ